MRNSRTAGPRRCHALPRRRRSLRRKTPKKAYRLPADPGGMRTIPVRCPQKLLARAYLRWCAQRKTASLSEKSPGMIINKIDQTNSIRRCSNDGNPQQIICVEYINTSVRLPPPREAHFFCTSLAPEREKGDQVAIKFIKTRNNAGRRNISPSTPYIPNWIQPGCGRHDRFKIRLNQPERVIVVRRGIGLRRNGGNYLVGAARCSVCMRIRSRY
jgi:hypothetical protein